MTTDTAAAQLEIRIQGIKEKNGKLGILRIAIFCCLFSTYPLLN
jgi:cell division protein ZapA (FtsZ GTPase activity inhibitor)